MPTLNLQIASSADDGTWAEGNSQFIGTAVFTGYFGGAQVISNSFYRFQLNIAKGSTISSAVLTFTAYDTYTNSGVNTTLKAIADDNASAPTTYSGAEGASRTTASVSWNAISNWTGSSTYTSPDISTVLQEIIDRAGWVSGNYVVIYWEDNGSTSSQYRRAIDYNASSSQAAKLDITYSDPAPAYNYLLLEDGTSGLLLEDDTGGTYRSMLLLENGYDPSPYLRTGTGKSVTQVNDHGASAPGPFTWSGSTLGDTGYNAVTGSANNSADTYALKFDTSEILPSNGTITGIEIKVTAYSPAGTVDLQTLAYGPYAAVYKNGTYQSSTGAGQYIATTATVYTIGGSANTLSVTWAAGDTIDIALWVNLYDAVGTTPDCRITDATMTIWYSEGGSVTVSLLCLLGVG